MFKDGAWLFPIADLFTSPTQRFDMLNDSICFLKHAMVSIHNNYAGHLKAHTLAALEFGVRYTL